MSRITYGEYEEAYCRNSSCTYAFCETVRSKELVAEWLADNADNIESGNTIIISISSLVSADGVEFVICGFDKYGK